jgi:hypothetical protein
MNCADFKDWLRRRLDGETQHDHAEVDRHLADCSPCREWQAAARRLGDGLRLLAPPTPPVGLSNRIVAEVLAERRAALRFRRRRLISVAVAASLLVTALIGYPWWASLRSPINPDSPHAAVKLNAPDLPSATPSLGESFAEASSAVVSLAKKTKDETMEQTRLFWPNPVPAPELVKTEALQPALDPSAQGLRELEQGVSLSVEPVTSSLRRWGGMVLKTLPMETERKPGL